MIDLSSNVFNEIRYELVYPVELVTPRQVAIEQLQLKPHEFDRLRKDGHFQEFEYLGVKFFHTRELYDWAYKNNPDATQFLIPFKERKGR